MGNFEVGMKTHEEVEEVLANLAECMKAKDWTRALNAAEFRYYRGEADFPFEDQSYYIRYAGVYGEEAVNRVCFCYINFLEKEELHAFQDDAHAYGYIMNFLHCLHFAGFLYETFPRSDVALSNYSYLYYMMNMDTGLLLYNAAKKLGDKKLEKEMDLLRRTNSVKARDLHIEILNRHPNDVRARQRLRKLTD